MTSHPASYHGYRFPPEIISHAVWLYYRFSLSFRDAEDLLAQRGITVSYEAIRQWCQTFGLDYARRLRRRRGRMGDTWYLDELFVTIQGRQQYLWRAVDEDGDELDILVQSRRTARRRVRATCGRRVKSLVVAGLGAAGAIVGSSPHEARAAPRVSWFASFGVVGSGLRKARFPVHFRSPRIVKGATGQPFETVAENRRQDSHRIQVGPTTGEYYPTRFREDLKNLIVELQKLR